ncbi:MAG TPA: mannose-1-phosphate guanylyltransferase/mannose-6-phosphate isomerase [Armatimonadota bacterium]|jgi:mannose-1-phosphate guanylyltransferase/mannose-6-phosphate isomerase
MTPASHIYAVILAGGSGVRFWPLSRELDPKQLLSIFGTDSLISQAVSRMRPFLGPCPNPTMIITNERLVEPLRDHLTEYGNDWPCPVEFLIEPVGRNTAPALALVAAELMRRDPEAIMFVLPSDHLMQGEVVWAETVQAAIALARGGYFATIGLLPTRPETGYGYIAAGEPLTAFNCGNAHPCRATRFVEKPDRQHAEEYLRDGSFYWNAGMFCLSAAQCLKELAQMSSDGALIVETCRALIEIPRDRWLDDAPRARFAALPALSIDVALMEHSPSVAVIPAALNWHDVGSLLALETLQEADADGNIRIGRGVDVDAHGVTVYSTERLVATLGMEDILVVDTRDATLICPKDRCQDVRAVVNALHVLGAAELAEPCRQVRRWGSWTTLLHGDNYQIKLVELYPGARTAVQRHQQRSEHWVVLEGSAVVWRDADILTVGPNEMIDIPAGATHGLTNIGATTLKVIEIQSGVLLNEDDTERMTPTMVEDTHHE